ncbi:MAG: histidinol-phosphate transaminase [Microbacteriaceae bacterium]
MTSSRVRLRPEIQSMVPYRQGKPAAADAFKLSSNENPFDPLPAVVEAIASASVNRYPDATAAELRARLGQRFGVNPEAVQIGSGSVAILAQLISATAAPGDEVLYSWRSFEAYPLLATVAGATSVAIANTPDHRHNLPAMAAAVTDRTRLIIVCSPNNPTGTVVTADEFADFMAVVPHDILVVLDEAYVEFVTEKTAVDGATLIGRYPNLVILRTFSKAYGLAGLRIGYAIGPEYVMDAARATAIPLSVIGAAQRAAIVSLDHEDELMERVALITERRQTIAKALEAQGWKAPASQANFVWLPTGEDSQWAAEVFLEHGIVARAYGSEGVRVSVGEAESVDKLLSAAAEVVTKLLSKSAEATLD